MRIAVLIVTLVMLGGCASTGHKNAEAEIPVQSEDPSPFERWRVSQQRINEQTSMARTQIAGRIIR